MRTAPALAGYHHVGITVTDVETSESWYSETLGLVRAFVEPHAGSQDGGYAVVMTRPGTPFFLGLDHHAEADKLPFDAVARALTTSPSPSQHPRRCTPGLPTSTRSASSMDR